MRGENKSTPEVIQKRERSTTTGSRSQEVPFAFLEILGTIATVLTFTTKLTGAEVDCLPIACGDHFGRHIEDEKNNRVP
jgi:hypothetical protein